MLPASLGPVWPVRDYDSAEPSDEQTGPEEKPYEIVGYLAS